MVVGIVCAAAAIIISIVVVVVVVDGRRGRGDSRVVGGRGV